MLSSQTVAEGLVQIGSTLYFPDGSSTIYSVPAAGGSVSTVVSGLTGATQLETDGTNLFIRTTEIDRVSPSGGTPMPVLGGSTDSYTLAGGKIYANEFSSTIVVANSDGTGATTFASNLSFPRALAGDATNLYFIAGGTGSEALYKMAESTPGGTPQMVADLSSLGPNDVDQLVGSLLYIQVKNGQLATVDTSTGKVTPISITGVTAVSTSFALDATSVYFINKTNLYKAPLAGGAATELCAAVSTSSFGVNLLADATHVYVENNGSNGIPESIVAVPK